MYTYKHKFETPMEDTKMKKLSALLLAVILVLSLAACASTAKMTSQLPTLPKPPS